MTNSFNAFLIDKHSKLDDRVTVEKIVEQILANPLLTFYKMGFNDEGSWANDVDLDKAVQVIINGKKRSVEFVNQESPHFKVSLNKDVIHNSINLELPEKYILSNTGELLKDYLIKICFSLPAFRLGSLGVINSISDFYDLHTINMVPADAVRLYVDWWHIMAPEIYKENFTREDMLGIPAYKVNEHANGWIEMQVWDKPFEYGKKENLDRLRAVTEYLIDKRKDLD